MLAPGLELYNLLTCTFNAGLGFQSPGLERPGSLGSQYSGVPCSDYWFCRQQSYPKPPERVGTHGFSLSPKLPGEFLVGQLSSFFAVVVEQAVVQWHSVRAGQVRFPGQTWLFCFRIAANLFLLGAGHFLNNEE